MNHLHHDLGIKNEVLEEEKRLNSREKLVLLQLISHLTKEQQQMAAHCCCSTDQIRSNQLTGRRRTHFFQFSSSFNHKFMEKHNYFGGSIVVRS
jgi:hypothetical protein